MKRIVLTFTLGLLLLSTLAKAQTTITDQSVTRYSDGSSSQSSSATVIRDYEAERREAREQAKEAREQADKAAQAQAAALAKLEPFFRACADQCAEPSDRQLRGLYQDWLKHNRQIHEELARLSSVDRLSDSYKLPLPNTYDDEATIRLYLRDSGYNDLSDAQIVQVQAYMKANHIKHVSELGQ